MAMPPSRSYPNSVFARRNFPTSALPYVGVAVPAMVAWNPDMARAWPNCSLLVDTDGRATFYNDLRMGGHQTHRHPKHRGKKKFPHSLSSRGKEASGRPFKYAKIRHRQIAQRLGLSNRAFEEISRTMSSRFLDAPRNAYPLGGGGKCLNIPSTSFSIFF